jgi:hypothetical protein
VAPGAPSFGGVPDLTPCEFTISAKYWSQRVSRDANENDLTNPFLETHMRFICVAQILSMCCSIQSVNASQLWGISSGSGTSFSAYPIDVSSGAISAGVFIDNFAVRGKQDDLASDPVREPSVIWLLRNTLVGSELVAVDTYQRQILSSTKLSAPKIVDLAIDPTTGVMYGSNGGALFSIARDTGVTMLIGTDARLYGSLGFDAHGNLYSASTFGLFAVDKLTGSISVIRSGLPYAIADFAVRPESGVVYGITGPPAYFLFQFDLVGGNINIIGGSLGRPGGIAFTAVPESTGLFPWSLFLITAGMRLRLPR